MALHPDRLLPADPAVRQIARRLYEQVRDLPIISPHGHVDPRLLLDDAPFRDIYEVLEFPLPHSPVRWRDTDGRDRPDGQPGALLTRGPYTPRGYYRAPEQNARAFTPDGWYASGDVVRRRPDGNLVVEGRDKDMINRGGEKISAEEVENLLYRMPGIAQVAAVAAPDAELGERICVFVVPEPGRDIGLGAIRDGLEAAGVAKFKWPERLEIVAELPVTKMGKLDKKALRDMLAGRSTP